ncbi:MAG: D-tyrosyl-tRNA(Tyr) deacylase [Planctomycetota bacterium]|nr:MAG: D-tyrosyl-tRNA(Tyr) deacylase [Planctomycetota bacterium]
MRAVLQRVSHAQVRVDGEVVGSIGAGLFVLLAIAADDTDADEEWLCAKVARSRLFTDEQGKMNLDCAAIAGEFLVVSQFTLLATTVKGNRPGFPHGALPAEADRRYQRFACRLGELSGCRVATGRFAAHMAVELCNDGPVTIIMDSKLRE